MDFAYDHITEEVLKNSKAESENNKAEQSTLNADFQEAYKAISSSPWGLKLGGFLGNVVKQGESVYKEAQQELTAVGEEATKGFTDLRSQLLSRTRALSLAKNPAAGSSTDKSVGGEETPTAEKSAEGDATQEGGVFDRFKVEAAKRLKDLQEAEDAADEALLKFGTNIRNFLRDAVSIAPPSSTEGQGNTVLFESKDAQGKRVFHSTRFDAQMHVIHTSLDSFLKDPESAEFETWAKDFDVEKKTDDISKDLEDYAELRTSMEKLVPDRVKYEDFWKRYYFLRHSIETAEARRKDLLKAASAEEEVGWDEDSEEEEEGEEEKPKVTRSASAASSRTIHPPANNNLKPTEPRKSHDEKSSADSDASYDVVGAASGAPSRAPNSPKETKKDEDSDDDWE